MPSFLVCCGIGNLFTESPTVDRDLSARTEGRTSTELNRPGSHGISLARCPRSIPYSVHTKISLCPRIETLNFLAHSLLPFNLPTLTF